MASNEKIENRSLQDHRDSWGLLTYRRWRSASDKFEGGDTAHREGAFIFFSALTGGDMSYLRQWYHQIKLLLAHPIEKGVWRRHPDVGKWYGDWDRMSRDQATSLVVAMSILGLEDELEIFYGCLFRRGSFMTNSRHNGVYPFWHGLHDPRREKKWADKKPFYRRDFCGPEFWAIYWRFKIARRGWKYWWAYPLVWLGDVENLINSLIKVRWYGIDPDNADDNNHILISAHAQRVTETFILRLSRRYYFRRRPHAGDPYLKEYEVTNGPMSAMRKYYDGSAWNGDGASPPLDRLGEKVVNALGD